MSLFGDEASKQALLKMRMRQVVERASTKRGAKRLILKELRECKKAGALQYDDADEKEIVDDILKLVWFIGG